MSNNYDEIQDKLSSVMEELMALRDSADVAMDQVVELMEAVEAMRDKDNLFQWMKR